MRIPALLVGSDEENLFCTGSEGRVGAQGQRSREEFVPIEIVLDAVALDHTFLDAVTFDHTVLHAIPLDFALILARIFTVFLNVILSTAAG